MFYHYASLYLANLESVYIGCIAVLFKCILTMPSFPCLGDNRKFYNVEDFLESWTGSVFLETQGIKYEKLLEIYAKEESTDNWHLNRRVGVKWEHLCAFCNIRSDAGKINSLSIPTSDQCQLDCMYLPSPPTWNSSANVISQLCNK